MRVGSIVEETTDARALLARSPSFAMSLGAKELFHTNFLGFLLESDHEELEDVRLVLRDALCFPVASGERSRCFVWREKSHLDLVLVPVSSARDEPVRTRALVVEAKLKSIPSWQQLEGYLNKNLKSLRLDHGEKRHGFPLVLSTDQAHAGIKPDLVLLTPTDHELHEAWTTASWSAIQANLRDAALRLPAESPFASILKDYANALGALLKVIAATRAFVQHACDSPEVTYGSYESELTRPELRRLRLHDLVGKLANDEWARRLECRLVETVGARAGSSVTCYSHFSNSQPGLSVEVSAPNGFQIGVQIQGRQFRRYVSSTLERADLEHRMLRSHMREKWFMQSVCDQPLTGVRKPTAGALTNLRCFNNKKFLYSALDLQGMRWPNVEIGILGSVQLALQLAAETELWG